MHPTSDPSTLYIDGSALEGRFMRCPREYFYNVVRKRESVGPGAGRAFGKAFHEVMAFLDTGLPQMPDSVSSEEKDEIALAHIGPNAPVKWTLEQQCQLSHRHNCAALPMDDHRTLAFLREVVDKYVCEYPNNPFWTLTAAGVPIVEHPFSVPLGTVELSDGRKITVMWCGKIDKITVWSDSTHWNHDYKTSAIGGEGFWNNFQNSTAQVGYCWAIHKLFGIMPAGYLIDAIFVRKPSRTGKGIEFGRQKYPITPDHFTEWEHNTLQTIANALRCAEQSYFPKHTNACVHKYGTCEFLPVCRLPGTADKEALLASNMYQDVHWSPLQ